MGKLQRNKGLRFERWVIQQIRHIWPKAISARAESRTTDAKGVDICETPGVQIQCKSVSKAPNYHKLLSEMDPDSCYKQVVLHEYTQGRGESNRFMVQGRYAIMRMDDFIALLEEANYQRHGVRRPAE